MCMSVFVCVCVSTVYLNEMSTLEVVGDICIILSNSNVHEVVHFCLVEAETGSAPPLKGLRLKRDALG